MQSKPTLQMALPALQRIARAEKLNLKKVKHLRIALEMLRQRQSYIDPKLSREIGDICEKRLNLN